MKEYLIILIGLILLVTLSNEINAQETITVMNATLPSPRRALSCMENSADGKIYCFGGESTTGNQINQIVEYDSFSDNISIKNTLLPTGRSLLSCAENSATH
ncbi:MAG: hypothetical protein AABY07_07865, partial [Nanoarchaeota archaeon]